MWDSENLVRGNHKIQYFLQKISEVFKACWREKNHFILTVVL